MKKSIFTMLTEYSRGDIYPYHMPGHKRQEMGELPQGLCGIDITEIEGFDNLHDARGILKEAQEKAALLYGAKESFFLVNGSTAGVLTAVSSALPKGGKLLVARNCHKSVYHGAYLRNLDITYLYPEKNKDFDICEPVEAEKVREALEKDPQIQAVIIVSPTYEGRIANVQEIAKVVHERNIPLIVDEAHGAHLGMHHRFEESSIRKGADLVIQSLHKTLPSLTQTALLHYNSDLVSLEMVKRFLQIYQSSSPSYLLIASMDSCVTLMRERGEELLQTLYERWTRLRSQLDACKHLSFLQDDEEKGIKQDIGKLVISVKNTGITGVELYHMLLEEYHLQLEMACDTYVLAMLTVGDSQEGFDRLRDALLSIDQKLEAIEKKKEKENPAWQEPCRHPGEKDSSVLSERIPLWEAFEKEGILSLLLQAEGKWAAEFVAVYPPGIPILVPGEKYTKEVIELLSGYLSRNLSVQGVYESREGFMVKVIEEGE